MVAPGHTEVEARKVAREICALPADAVAIYPQAAQAAARRRAAQDGRRSHHFGERLKSDEARNAFSAFFARKKKA